MLLLILIAFSLLASSFTVAEEDCSGHVSVVCAPRLEHPSFPETAENLKSACRELIKSFGCAVDYEKKCNTEPGVLAKSIKVFDVLKEVCKESTLLHTVVVENLGCYKGLLDPKIRIPECNTSPPDEKTLETQAIELLKEGLDVLTNQTEVDKYSCLKQVNRLACKAVLVQNNCGTRAKDAYVEIVEKIDIPTVTSCGDKLSGILPAVIRLQSVANEVEEALKRRKK